MKKRKFMILVVTILFIAISTTTGYYCYMNKYYVITDDAHVDGTIISVSPQITGKIADIYVQEGEGVFEGQNIVRQADTSLSNKDSLDLTILKSPISGTVIKKIGNIGEVGTPGTPILMLANLKNLYITAEVEETEISKIRQKQSVEFSIDAFPNVRFKGQVISIMNATVSTFNLLPSQNTGDNYTKVVARVPVKISIEDYQGCQLMPGMNVTVKINIAR